MSEVVPPTTSIEVFATVIAIGIGVAVALALLMFISNQIVEAFKQSGDHDDWLQRNMTADLLETMARGVRPQEKSKLKNDDLEFEGEDYFEEDEYASFEELLAEKPKRKNDDYE